MQLASAGHEPPFVRRANGAIEAESEDVVLGIEPNPNYTRNSLRLFPGDTLLGLYRRARGADRRGLYPSRGAVAPRTSERSRRTIVASARRDDVLAICVDYR